MWHLRFRMRTMFVLVTMAACWYASYTLQAQRQRAAVAEIRQLGGRVLYEAAAYDAEALRLLPLLVWALGPDWFHSVDGVYLPRATDDSLAVLGALPTTKKLSLRNVTLTVSGLKHIASLSDLESLELAHGRLDDECMLALANLKHLKHLEVRGASITDGAMTVISQLPAIRSVLLANCDVTDSDLQAFRNSTKIAWLGLLGTQITDASTPVFLSMPNLEELHLDQASINEEGLQRLALRGSLRTVTLRQGKSAASTILFPR